MALRVIKSGILDTIQDLGRYGWQSAGINPNGVMDPAAATIVNLLLANDENSPVIELHFPAGQYRFEAPAAFALGGADFGAELDGVRIENWRILNATGGSVLRFRRKNTGMRCYLGISGGFAVDERLGSSSTNLIAAFGGIGGRRLLESVEIPFSEYPPPARIGPGVMVSNSLIPRYSSFPTVRFTSGAEFEDLDASGVENIINSPFTVSTHSDRMGYRLEGSSIKRKTGSEILSSAVTFGTIQLLPTGQLIVLMADHQTTGGYPRIGNVISVDLPLLAQLGPGDRLFFGQISHVDAESLMLDFQRELALFKTACGFI